MVFSDALSYFITLIAISLAPGPVALLLIVRSASRDISGAIGFGAGFAFGGLIIITAVCFGLGTWLQDVPEFFAYSEYVMLAYVFWLARRIWKGGFDLSSECRIVNRSMLSAICAGVATCFISPYMMILFPLVLPGMIDITTIHLPEFAVVAVLTFSALSLGAALIIAFAAQITRLARSPRSMMILNRSLSGILAIGGSWMAFG